MEGSNMIRTVMLAAGMLVIGAAAATAQEKDCFSVTSPAQATLGSILINRCTGATWILNRVRTNTGTIGDVGKTDRQLIFSGKGAHWVSAGLAGTLV
jgi:hypothetical protein